MSIAAEIRALPRGVSDLRKFGWTVGAVLLGLGGGFWLWKQAAWGPWVAGAGALLALLGLIAPKLLDPVYLGWMSLAVALGFVMTRVLLTLFFFAVLTPVALLFKLIGKDPLHRKLDRGAATYWIPKEYPIADRTRFEKYF